MTHASWGALLLCALLSCSLDRDSSAPDLRDMNVVSGGGSTRLDAGATNAGHGDGSNAGSGVSTGGHKDSGAGSTTGNADAATLDASPSLDAARDAGPEGYVPGAVGAPCLSDSDCRIDGSDRICFKAGTFEPLLTLPAGYCGKFCEVGKTPPCEKGATCITFPTFPPVLACMRACGGDSDCRVDDGYSCNKPFTSNASVCSLRN